METNGLNINLLPNILFIFYFERLHPSHKNVIEKKIDFDFLLGKRQKNWKPKIQKQNKNFTSRKEKKNLSKSDFVTDFIKDLPMWPRTKNKNAFFKKYKIQSFLMG